MRNEERVHAQDLFEVLKTLCRQNDSLIGLSGWKKSRKKTAVGLAGRILSAPREHRQSVKDELNWIKSNDKSLFAKLRHVFDEADVQLYAKKRGIRMPRA